VVSSNEDEPLQKCLRQLSGARAAVLDEVAAADKEAANKRAAEEAVARRATEEATVKRATEEIASKRVVEERATKEAVTKKATEERAAEESTTKAAAVKAIGAAGGSPAPGQVPSVAGAKRAAASSGSTSPAKRPYRGVWKPRFVQLSLPLFSFFSFFVASFSYYPFCPGPLPPTRRPLWARLPQMR
jgi:hypothetical protein